MNVRRRNTSLPLLKTVLTQAHTQQQNTLDLPTRKQPGRSRSKWSMLVESRPEADLFEIDEQRSIAAFHALEELSETTSVNTNGLSALRLCRSSAYYQSLQEKLNRKEKLVLSEYMYYALTTDKLNTLDIELLRAVMKREDVLGFHPNLEILIAARQWQDAVNTNEKTELNIKLQKAIKNRGYLARSGEQKYEYYLNLHGINLTGADLSFAKLDYTDLTEANLSHTKLNHAHICHSSLNHANLSHAFSSSRGQTYEESHTKIEHTIALDANFDEFNGDNISMKFSDFSGSYFKKAKLGIGIAYDLDAVTTFDYADFDGASLHFLLPPARSKTLSIKMRFANLTNTEMHDAYYESIDLEGAKLMAIMALSSPELFRAGLDDIHHRMLQPLVNSEYHADLAAEKSYRILCLQKSIAHSILFHFDKCKLDKSDQQDLLNIAHAHPVFLKSFDSTIVPAQVGDFLHTISVTLFGQSKAVDNSAAAILEKALSNLDNKRNINAP